MLPMKYLVFNPEQYEVRKIPSFVIRTGKNEIIAFSRICPRDHDHILNFVLPRADGSCGCLDQSCKGYCIGYAKTPSLVCPCDKSVFDVANNGRAICGSAYYARQLSVSRNGKWISIERLENFGIV
jgi:nitrite reductase/ring-hydroxylating ferredoxin subunit